MSERKHLPNRRDGISQKAQIGPYSIYIHTGEYEDGTLGEVFVRSKRPDDSGGLLNAFAIALSIGLQYGAPLEAFVEALTFTRFEPSGPVTGHPDIRMCTSSIDYVMRALAIHYLERADLAHGDQQDDTP